MVSVKPASPLACPMDAYLDQNVLIYLANRPEWLAVSMAASSEGRIRYVLSPWHFYEIGKIEEQRRDELLAVAANLNPAWILDRADLQLVEFLNAWRGFWNGYSRPLRAVSTLADVGSFLLRITPERAAEIPLERYVREIARPGGTDLLKPVFADQKRIASANQESFRSGRYTKLIDHEVKHVYVARLLARERETGPSLPDLYERMAEILADPLCGEKIKFFVEFGGMADLRTWEIDARLTALHMAGQAVLSENRQVDRQHACVALAYCDLFVTNDDELLRRSSEVSVGLNFPAAECLRPEALIERLSIRRGLAQLCRHHTG